jgi:hypothetical protein
VVASNEAAYWRALDALGNWVFARLIWRERKTPSEPIAGDRVRISTSVFQYETQNTKEEQLMTSVQLTLDDEQINKKLDQLVEKHMARITEGAILEKLEEMLAKKLDRKDAGKIMEVAAKELLIEEFGTPRPYGMNTDSKYSRVMAEQGEKLLNQHVKILVS